MIANVPSHIPSLVDRRTDRGCGIAVQGAVVPAIESPGMSESFVERFCCHFDVPIENFEAEILRRTLYPHARWVNLFAPCDFFHPDRSFVSNVGRLMRRDDFAGEAKEFQRDPCNEGFLRRHCRLRVSVGRMRRLFDAIWPEPTALEPLSTDLE